MALRRFMAVRGLRSGCGAGPPLRGKDGRRALSRRGGKADSAAPWLLHGRQHGARESDLLLDTEGQLLLL